jgi:hypothetical protein
MRIVTTYASFVAVVPARTLGISGKVLSYVLRSLFHRDDDGRRGNDLAYRSFILGSKASRNPSPMKLMHNTVIRIITPGYNVIQGALKK